MHSRRSRSRRSRTIAALAATAIVAGVGIVNMQLASAAAPTLNAPGRIYPAVGAEYAFSGSDGVSGDAATLSVSGMVEGANCDVSAPLYAITDCPRVQMDLNTGEAGLLKLVGTSLVDGPDGDAVPDLLVHSSGAVVTEHTETDGSPGLVFNFNGTEAMLNDVLGDISFVPAANYEEKDTADGDLPNITILAIQGDDDTQTTERAVYIKVEGVNDAPTLDAPVAPVDAPAGATTEVETVVAAQDLPSVIDPEMCNNTVCGDPFTNPGQVESDDVMLLVAWIPEASCGTFNFISSAVIPTLGSGTNSTVHTLLTNDIGGLNLENDQALAIEASIAPEALLLSFSAQPGSVDSPTITFAGVGELEEIRWALAHIDYNAPADDATCHLNYTVSDLGNNGAPDSYVGSASGTDSSGEAPQPGHEVPDAKGATTNIAFNVFDSHPDVTVEQTLLGPLGDPAGPNRPASFTITFSEAIDPTTFAAGDLAIGSGTADGETGLLAPVTPGLVYTFVAEATGDGTIVVSLPAGTVFAAGHSGDSEFDTEASTSDDNEITWDATAPTVTIGQAAAQADPTGTSPIVFTVVFDETITTAPVQFDGSDIDFTGSTAGGTLVATVTQPDLLDLKTYEVAVSGMTDAGTVVAGVKASAILDQALNPSDASTSTDDSVDWSGPPDTTDPTVTIDQKVGQADPTSTSPIDFTVVFSEPVAGFTGADVDLTASTATGSLVANVTGGPDTYNVAVSGMDGDGDVTATIAAGAATDAANNPNEAASTSDNTVTWDQPVDTTDPTVTIDQKVGQADPTSTAPIDFTVVFSEPVAGFTGADVDLTASTATGSLVANVTGGPDTYNVAVSGMDGDGDVTATIAAGAATDAANNPNEASTTSDDTVTWDQPVDNVAPTVTVEQAGGQVDPTSTSPILFTATFSEPVTDFVDADVTVGGNAGGTLAAVVSGGPSAYTITVSGMTTSGTVTASVDADKAVDGGANGNTASTSNDNSVTWNQPVDNVSPDVTVEEAGGQADPTATSPIEFTATFTEPVSGFTSADVSLAGSTVGGILTPTVTGGPSTYTISVSGMTTGGTVIASIPAGAAIDAADNANTVSTSADHTVTWQPITDSIPPSVTVEQPGGQADPTNVSPVLFTATFTEPVSGFTNADVSLAGSTAGGTLIPTVTGGPSTYTISISGMTTGGTVIASIPAGAAIDAASNANTVSTSTDHTVTWVQVVDNTAPSVTVEQAGGQADPTSTSPILFTATFSEPVTGFTNADVSLAGSGAGGTLTPTVTGGPAVYTITVSGMTTSGTVIASVPAGAAIDAATNASTVSTSSDHTVQWNQVVDNTAPTVTINQAAGQADPTASPVIEFTATFSEPVAGFAGDDVGFTGSTAVGTLVAVATGGPSVYTVTVTGVTGPGTVVASIPAGAASDAATNASAASTSADASVTYAGPITIATGGGSVTVGVLGGAMTSFTTQAPSVPPPAGFTFPYGQLDFNVTTTPGSLVSFTITLPTPADAYFKLVSGAWQAFAFDGETGAQLSGSTITVTIRDDGRGDDDPTAGVVSDPGAPAQVAQTGPTTTSTTAPTGSTTTTGATGGATSTTAATGGSTIPRTGTDTAPLTYVGFGLIAIGVGIIVSRRRPWAA